MEVLLHGFKRCIIMKTLLPEMKELLTMALNGATDKEMLESSSYTWLEFHLGERYASTWYEMYIELTNTEEKEELLTLPDFIKKEGY